MRWNEEQSTQMQEERNRIRHYMQELRVQIAQAMTGNKDHLDSISKAVSLDESIHLNLPRVKAPDIAAEMMAHDANNDDDVRMEPIDSMTPATVNLAHDQRQYPSDEPAFTSSIFKTARSFSLDGIDNDMQHSPIQTHARAFERVTNDSNNQAGGSSNADMVYDRDLQRGGTWQHLQVKYPSTTIKEFHAPQASGKSRLLNSVDENKPLQVMRDIPDTIGEQQSRKRKQPLQTKDDNTRAAIPKGKRTFGDKRNK